MCQLNPILGRDINTDTQDLIPPAWDLIKYKHNIFLSVCSLEIEKYVYQVLVSDTQIYLILSNNNFTLAKCKLPSRFHTHCFKSKQGEPAFANIEWSLTYITKKVKVQSNLIRQSTELRQLNNKSENQLKKIFTNLENDLRKTIEQRKSGWCRSSGRDCGGRRL